MRTYSYRGKLFMYDPDILKSVEGTYGITVLDIVRNGIDDLIAKGEKFQRVQAIFDTSGPELNVEVTPV